MENPFESLLRRTAPTPVKEEPLLQHHVLGAAASDSKGRGSENNGLLGNSQSIVSSAAGSYRTPSKGLLSGSYTPVKASPRASSSSSAAYAHTPNNSSSTSNSRSVNGGESSSSSSSKSSRKMSAAAKVAAAPAAAPAGAWQSSPGTARAGAGPRSTSKSHAQQGQGQGQGQGERSTPRSIRGGGGPAGTSTGGCGLGSGASLSNPNPSASPAPAAAVAAETPGSHSAQRYSHALAKQTHSSWPVPSPRAAGNSSSAPASPMPFAALMSPTLTTTAAPAAPISVAAPSVAMPVLPRVALLRRQSTCRTLDAAFRLSLGQPAPCSDLFSTTATATATATAATASATALPTQMLYDQALRSRLDKQRQSLQRLRSRKSSAGGAGAEDADAGAGAGPGTTAAGGAVLGELRRLALAASVKESAAAATALLLPLQLPPHAGPRHKGDKDDSKGAGEEEGGRRESMVLDQALVRQMLPRKVCLPLRQGKPVPPEAFSDVAIFFSDVVGFTSISAGVAPIRVLQLLNTLFTVMDYCCSLFPLYKVETIGDAYMVAGGLPERDPNSAQHLADFALVVAAAVAAAVVSPLDGTPIRIRMGCHTGKVMAGVVGTLMPRYCLFGDTVNTASRMESNGEAGRVHCSEAFAQKLLTTSDATAGTEKEPGGAGQRHVLQERGLIDIKGKGAMRTYWLERSLSVSEERLAAVAAHCVDLAANSLSFEDQCDWEGEEGETMGTESAQPMQ